VCLHAADMCMCGLVRAWAFCEAWGALQAWPMTCRTGSWPLVGEACPQLLRVAWGYLRVPTTTLQTLKLGDVLSALPGVLTHVLVGWSTGVGVVG
jgi:hypothetical protein